MKQFLVRCVIKLVLVSINLSTYVECVVVGENCYALFKIILAFSFCLSVFSDVFDLPSDPIRSRHGHHGITWDGRLLLGTRYMERVNGVTKYSWSAQVFRPRELNYTRRWNSLSERS